MAYLFTSESVSEGHPDKIADQISDALLDEFLRHDPDSKVACETLVTTGLVFCAGEVRTNGWVDIQTIAREVIRDIGYTRAEYMFDADSCGIVSAIHGQSDDIYIGVERQKEEEQGAGDQGMMFGYANKDMDNYMPIALELAHLLLQELAAIRKEGKNMTYLRPDSKSQVTIEYEDDGTPVRIDTLLVSTQHDEFIIPKDGSAEAAHIAQEAMQNKIKQDIETYLIPRVKKSCPERVKYLFENGYNLIVNPTGKFVIGGPHGDTGLTGRKIIVDTYGGKGAHGGGAFSGKDASKVDRSAAYAARHIAKNMVAAGIASEVLVQLAYAIGIAEPVGVFINTFGTANAKNQNGKTLTDGEIAEKIMQVFDLRPFAIIKRFGLKNPVFRHTASYGHFGREPFTDEVEVYYDDHPDIYTKTVDGKEKRFRKVEFFAWEKLDYVEKLKKEFGVS
ncbi:MAG: methionine adenosyltransferase [Chlorobi bacterium]|nr:methionine adenosyltransferase [Chlorobiota bacterium]